MILSFQTDMPGQTVQSSLIRVYTVCYSVCIVWTHYSMVEPHSSNFRVITTNLLGVRIFRKFKVCVKQVQNLLGTGYSRYVDFAYLDTITYVEVIFHSQNVFSIYLCISTPSVSKTVNMKQRVSRGNFSCSRHIFCYICYFLCRSKKSALTRAPYCLFWQCTCITCGAKIFQTKINQRTIGPVSLTWVLRIC